MIGNGSHVRFVERAVEDHQFVEVADVLDTDHDGGFAVIPCEFHGAFDASLGFAIDKESRFRIGRVGRIYARD